MRVNSAKIRCQFFDYFLSTILIAFDPYFEAFLDTFEQLYVEKGEIIEHENFAYSQHENLFFEVPRAPKSKQNRFQDLFGTTCVLRSRFGNFFWSVLGAIFDYFGAKMSPKIDTKI